MHLLAHASGLWRSALELWLGGDGEQDVHAVLPARVREALPAALIVASVSAPCLALVASGRWLQRRYQRLPRTNQSRGATLESRVPLLLVSTATSDVEDAEPNETATRGALASCCMTLWPLLALAGARLAGCCLALWSLAVLAATTIALGVLAGSTAMALSVWQSCQEEGWRGFWAFLLCLLVGAAAACLVLALLRQPLRSLLLENPDPRRFDLRNDAERLQAVTLWRQDPMSRVEDRLAHLLDRLVQRKARVMSKPLVVAATLLAARLLFLWDFISDGLVALSLRGYHPIWASLSATAMLLPYIVLSGLLGPSGLCHLLGTAHPGLKSPLQKLAGNHVASAIVFVCFACPAFAYVDVWLVVGHLVQEPEEPSLFHYFTLRQLVEVFFEANFQVCLQAYIFSRQVNPFGILPTLQHTSVKPFLLALSLGSSFKASVDGLSKLSGYARLQTGGIKRRFLLRMLQFGEGLAPTNILEDIAKRETVEIASNLPGMDSAGLMSICRAVRASKTLRTFLLRSHAVIAMFQTDPVSVENALRHIFQNSQLRHLAFSGAVPARLSQCLRRWVEMHLRLESVQLGDGDDICCSNVMQELRGAPAPCMMRIVEGDLLGLSTTLRSVADPFAARLGGHGPLSLASAYGEAAILRRLLLLPDNRVADPKQVDAETGFFPLALAAENGHGRCVELLLAAAADPQQALDNGHFPLLLAAQGHERCVELLLAAKADPQQVNGFEGNFPLLMAAQEGHERCVELLLAAKAHPQQADVYFGHFPLLVAAHAGHERCVGLLLAAGADPKQTRQGLTAQEAAKEAGHSACEGLLSKALL